MGDRDFRVWTLSGSPEHFHPHIRYLLSLSSEQNNQTNPDYDNHHFAGLLGYHLRVAKQHDRLKPTLIALAGIVLALAVSTSSTPLLRNCSIVFLFRNAKVLKLILD